MAVTLTIDQLRVAVRAGDSPEELSDLTRLLAVGTALVLNHAPSAPDVIASQAVVMVVGQLYDKPIAGVNFNAAFRQCGAVSLLQKWRIHEVGGLTDTELAALVEVQTGEIYAWAQATDDAPVLIPDNAVSTRTGALSLTLSVTSYIVFAQASTLNDFAIIIGAGGDVLNVFPKGATTFQHNGVQHSYWLSTLEQRAEGTATRRNFQFVRSG